MPETESTLPADAPWWARWLAAEWRGFWKWSNTYLLGLAGAIPAAYEGVPGLKDAIPAHYMHYVEITLAALTFFNLLRRKAAGAAADDVPPAATQQGAKP